MFDEIFDQIDKLNAKEKLEFLKLLQQKQSKGEFGSETRKVVVNGCFGGPSISIKCLKYLIAEGSENAKTVTLNKHLNDEDYEPGTYDIIDEENKRHLPYEKYKDLEINDEEYECSYGLYKGWREDPHLIKAIETLGSEACSGSCAHLVVETVKIPMGFTYTVSNYDGCEGTELISL